MQRTSRAQETRTSTARPVIGGNEKGRLDLDFSAITASGMEVQWIREATLGEYDDDNVQLAMERGFTPVEAKDLPGFTTHRLPGARGSKMPDDTLVRRGGLVAMARPQQLAQAERAAHRRENADAIRSVAAGELSAPKDGINFQNITPEFEMKTERKGRFSETE
jgi:hypothetical protein